MDYMVVEVKKHYGSGDLTKVMLLSTNTHYKRIDELARAWCESEKSIFDYRMEWRVLTKEAEPEEYRVVLNRALNVIKQEMLNLEQQREFVLKMIGYTNCITDESSKQ